MIIALLWILIGTLGRVIIHIPDVTPLTSLCLLSPSVFSKRNAVLILLFILILSDTCLHFLFHYAILGSWTIFTYSGWFGIIFLGFFFAKNPSLFRALLLTVCATVIFWVWTNFGTWYATPMYSHTLQGLLLCYVAAIPFLKNAMAGSLVWTSVVMMLLYRSVSRPTLRIARNSAI